MIALALLFGGLACAPKPVRTEAPAPLAARPFVTPASTSATLSNGVRVVVIENHEIPLVWMRLAFTPGGFTDPVGKEGLASVTLDMMNEGAGSLDAAGLSLALKRLGSDLSSSSWDDGAAVSIQSLSRNLAPTLDLLGTVVRAPTFPVADWELMRKQRLSDLQRYRKDPESIAARVYDRVLFGDAYLGRLPNEATYASLSPDDMRAWWAANITSTNAIFLVGGDTTLAELVPLLEARFGSWTGGASVRAPAGKPLPITPAIHFVDRPGAAQSVLRVGGYVATPTDADWFDLMLANHAIGGQFTSRLNMNLREDKGYTYGARSGLGYDFGGGRWTASAGVHTDKTALALAEIFKEIKDPGAARPLAEAEVVDSRASLIYSWPLRFEGADFLLGQEENVWRYGLPKSWIGDYLPRISAVTPQGAQAAWTARIRPESLTCVVVGDGAAIRASLATAGLPIIDHDADGNIVGGATDGN